MSKSDMNIAKALDIDLPPVTEEKAIEPKILDAPSTGKEYKPADADSDYEEVRRNLKILIEQSNSAIQSSIELAEDSQQPRAYEVVAQLIGQTMEANTKLIDLHRRMKDIKKTESGAKPTNVTNNSIFVGSTSELQKLIRGQKKMLDNVKPDSNEKN